MLVNYKYIILQMKYSMSVTKDYLGNNFFEFIESIKIIEISFKFSFFFSEQFELKSHENTIGTSDRILHKEQLDISV